MEEDDKTKVIDTDEVKQAEAKATKPKKRKTGARKKRAKKAKDGKKHPVRRFFKYFFLVLLALLIIGGIALFIAVYPYYSEYKGNANEILMNMDETVFRRAGNTTIYDKDDEAIGQIGTEKYEYVPLSDVSQYVIDGYVVEEDKRFYEHSGVDWQATFRAGLALIENKGEITQGGSTITQQVVKNNLLSQEQTYARKITEMMLALELEKQYSKSQIMEFYVNSCYYGNNCYGIEGAAEYYFDETSKSLTLGEAAMLIATSNAPSACNPVADYDGIIEKRNAVLDDMLADEKITQEEYDDAVEEEPEIVQKSENIDADNYMISYALHCTTIEVMKQDNFKFEYVFESGDDYAAYKKKYDRVYNNTLSDIRSGGYDIYTSFDQSVQKKLQASVDDGLEEFTATQDDGRYNMQGAATCIDNDTGLIIAMVGGRGTDDSFNRGYQATRQPGSSIKPLLDYGPAINEGYITPASTITDEEITVNGYSPRNSGGSYYGNVTAREAIARSLNTVAFQLMLSVGRDTALDYLGEMQFSSLAWADSTANSISIGGFTNGVTVADMAKGYATIENQGVYTDTTCLRKVVTEAGDEIYNYEDANEKEVYLDDTAFMLTDMMQGVFQESYGTAHSKKTDSQYYAGKTGTTNDNKDAWFCGFSAYYTTVVWTGCDTPKSVDGLYGNTYPLSIWSDFMSKMHDGLEKKDFPIPDTVYLENSSGKTKDITYTKDVYKSRPSGYDYVSSKLKQLNMKTKEEIEREEKIRAAEEAVSEFEEYQIESYEDALNLDTYYNEVLEVINQVDDPVDRADFIDRAAYKYGLLSTDVKTAWADAEEVIKAAEQEAKDAENAQAAADSIARAQSNSDYAKEKAKTDNINVVKSYINSLNSATYYSSNIPTMISQARSALAKCSGYSEYSDLSSKLESAISRAQNLPESPSTNSSSSSSSSSDSGTSSSSGSSSSSSSGSGSSGSSGSSNSSGSSSGSGTNNNSSSGNSGSSGTSSSGSTSSDSGSQTNSAE